MVLFLKIFTEFFDTVKNNNKFVLFINYINNVFFVP